MKKIKVPGVDLELSPIAFGCDSKRMERDINGIELFDDIFKLGINVFDTARGYGKSESVIGIWVKTHPEERKNICIITKGCLPYPFSRVKPSCLKRDLAKSLKTLNTYIDVYLLHRDDKRCDLKEIFSVLNQAKLDGKIKGYGVSNWSVKRVEEANKVCKENGFAPLIMSSVNFSPAPWIRDPWKGGDGCVSISRDEESQAYYKESNIPVLAYSPISRGLFSGKVKGDDINSLNELDSSARRAYACKENLEVLKRVEKIAKDRNALVSDIAISYDLSHEFLVIPSIGTNRKESMIKNIKASEIVLTKEEIDFIDGK